MRRLGCRAGWDQRPDAAPLRAEDLLAAPAWSFRAIAVPRRCGIGGPVRQTRVVPWIQPRRDRGAAKQLADSGPADRQTARELALAKLAQPPTDRRPIVADATITRPTRRQSRASRADRYCPHRAPDLRALRREQIDTTITHRTINDQTVAAEAGITNPACRRRRPVCRSRFDGERVLPPLPDRHRRHPKADRCTPATGGEFPTSALIAFARRRLPRNSNRTGHPSAPYCGR